MGVFEQFNAPSLLSHYGCRTFIETGTGIGLSLHYAATLPFGELHSCEIDLGLAQAAKSLFQDDPRIHIHTSNSEDMLRRSSGRLACSGGHGPLPNGPSS